MILSSEDPHPRDSKFITTITTQLEALNSKQDLSLKDVDAFVAKVAAQIKELAAKHQLRFVTTKQAEYRGNRGRYYEDFAVWPDDELKKIADIKVVRYKERQHAEGAIAKPFQYKFFNMKPGDKVQFFNEYDHPFKNHYYAGSKLKKDSDTSCPICNGGNL